MGGKKQSSDGNLPCIYVSGNGIAEAWENSVVNLADKGIWYERGGRKDKGREQVDSTMIIAITNPNLYPIYHKFMNCGHQDLVEYQFEILGAKDSWVDTTGESEKWSYHYHQRMTLDNQIEEMLRNLSKRPNTRQANASTWVPKIDTSSKDPPCLQRIWFSLIPDSEGNNFKLNMNYNFRSRNVMIASPMNQTGFATFQRYFRDRLQKMVDFPISTGRIVDISDSYHVSAKDQNTLDGFLRMMEKSKSRGEGIKERAYDLNETKDFFTDCNKDVCDKIINATIKQLEDRGEKKQGIEKEIKKINEISGEVLRINSSWSE